MSSRFGGCHLSDAPTSIFPSISVSLLCPRYYPVPGITRYYPGITPNRAMPAIYCIFPSMSISVLCPRNSPEGIVSPEFRNSLCHSRFVSPELERGTWAITDGDCPFFRKPQSNTIMLAAEHIMHNRNTRVVVLRASSLNPKAAAVKSAILPQDTKAPKASAHSARFAHFRSIGFAQATTNRTNWSTAARVTATAPEASTQVRQMESLARHTKEIAAPTQAMTMTFIEHAPSMRSRVCRCQGLPMSLL